MIKKLTRKKPLYHYQKRIRRRRHRWPVVLGVFLILLLVIGVMVVYDILNSQSPEITGETQIVSIESTKGTTKLFEEPYFTIELPGDWEEVERIVNAGENSVTWQATKQHEDNRYLKVYVDSLPRRTALNRFLPVEANGPKLITGNLSDNCVTFTKGGTLNAAEAVNRRETPAKWEEIDFICDLPRPFDNTMGTGSSDGLNIVEVTGPKQGTHTYFFNYVDHNKQANTQIFIEALKSFEAK